VYSRLQWLIHFLIALTIALAGLAAARGQTAAPAPAAVATASLHGHISDQTGALIPGAKITVSTAAGAQVATATADTAGAYEVQGLAAGDYNQRPSQSRQVS
jgi:hypothetical protein